MGSGGGEGRGSRKINKLTMFSQCIYIAKMPILAQIIKVLVFSLYVGKLLISKKADKWL